MTFGYNRTVEEPLIKEFSFVARPGQRIALVGSSGSGKSTIGRLAAGLYTPWSGEILYDGKPFAALPRAVFVSSVELVDSEICLFEGSVRDNLTLWDEMVSTERLVQAGVDAAIHGDLLQRRGGYSAPVAEQARNFSGGQRQRLQIARALVRDPSILILDEATSALDPKTEMIVDDNLRRRGCTCLIIAHRLTTIRDCDEIIVLSAGRVVQRGTHDELFAASEGEYARLVSHQALPAPRSSRFSLARRPAAEQSIVPFRGDPSEEISSWSVAPSIEGAVPFLDQELGAGAVHRGRALALQPARADRGQPSPAARRCRSRLVGLLGQCRRLFHAARARRGRRPAPPSLPGRRRGFDLRHQRRYAVDRAAACWLSGPARRSS